MLKLCDKYLIEYDAWSWKLITRIPSTHHKSKDGYIDELRWFPTLRMILVHILDRELKKDCKDAAEMLELLDQTQKEITELIDNKYNKWRKK